MNRSLTRTVSVALTILLAAATLLLIFFATRLPVNLIGRPPVEVPILQTNHPLQALYQLEAQAARDGWTSERLREAGDLWREAGDLTRAVAYWETAAPNAPLLRDRAQAYIELGRWADADDALDQLLILLPPNHTDRPWAQFQLGLIRASYDTVAAIDLLRAAEPTYGASVTNLLPLLAGAHEPTQVGIALAKVDQWAYAELAFSMSSDPLASAYRGLARDMQGKDGWRWIESALVLAPENPQVRFLQGLHLRLTYDYADSLQAIIQAVALDPENPALYAELGRAYQLSGDLLTAERWLKFAVTLDAQFQPVLDSFYNDEANTLLSLGIIDEAAFPFSATQTPEPESTVQP
jgi:tetratricopeptide (TPR) repeat protein